MKIQFLSNNRGFIEVVTKNPFHVADGQLVTFEGVGGIYSLKEQTENDEGRAVWTAMIDSLRSFELMPGIKMTTVPKKDSSR